MFNPKKTRFTQPLSSSHLSRNAHGLHIREYQGKERGRNVDTEAHKKTKKEKKEKQGKRRQSVGILKPDWDINGGKTHSIKFKGKPIFRLLLDGTKDIKKNIKIA